MKVWKITSGILSIALSLFVAAQSVFGGLLDILTSSGHSTGLAGIVVALILLTGGIVSIASSDGSMGADTALISLYGVGALVGFALAGGFMDLIVWALWCVLCAVLALVDFLLIYRKGDEAGREDEDEEDREEAAPEPPAAVRPPSLRSVILEKDPKKREAAIDALPERAAKHYLKQVIDAFVRHQPIPPDRPGRGALPAVLAVGGIVLLAGLLSWMLWGRGGEAGGPSDPDAAASQSVEPTAQPSQAAAVPTAGPAVAEGALGDYQVELKGAFLTRDHEGKAAVVITYTWTNHSERTMNAMSAFVEKAFQGGVQIDSALIMPQPGYDSGAPMRDLRPGASTDVQRAFLLADRTSPVEFEVSLFSTLSDEAVSALYDLEELVSVQ